MKVELLVSTMNNDPKKLVKKMNINSDAIIINQCDKVAYEEFNYNNHLIKVYHFNERGVGLSRNSALMRSTADIVLFADDDEVLVDNYEMIILNAFNNNKKADFIVFDIKTYGNSIRKYKKISKGKKVHWYNCLKYGAVRFAVKKNSIINKNIYFSLLFGGGAKYGSGEDSLFIFDCIKNGLKTYAVPTIIASVDMTSSSWFNGYTDRYLYDKGALFRAMKSRLSLLFLIATVLKNHKANSENKLLWELKKAIKGYCDFNVNRKV